MLKQFRLYRNKLTSSLRAARNSYFINIFWSVDQRRSDIIWRKVNTLLHPSNRASVPDIIEHNGEKVSGVALANAFNSFFIAQSDIGNVPAVSSFEKYLPAINTPHSLFFAPTTDVEVVSCINSLKNTHSIDTNGFQIRPIKYVLDLICPVITHIYNLILLTGEFPKAMQAARVAPVFKTGERHVINNYRPISILPIFSKGIEKILHIRVTSYLSKHEFLFDFQHGFRKHRSTETALLKQKETIIDAFIRKQLAIGIYIDFSKAFDLINHSILLSKLYMYGVRGIAYNLFKTYLAHRTQYVDVNGFKSSIQAIKAGVPQGSILGPLLFSIYINDIVNCTNNATFVSYADDTTVFATSTSEKELERQSNNILLDLESWAGANHLRINTKKTKVVVYSPKGKHIAPISVNLGSTLIEIVDSVKILGVIFSKHLTWNEHIQYVQSKASSAVGIIARMRHICPVKVKNLLYNSLIFSLFSYCSLVGCKTGMSNWTKLHLLQKSCSLHS